MDYVKLFIRKYIALLIPAGIVLVALLLLIPTVITGKTLRKEMKTSLGQLRSVQSWSEDVPSSDQAAIEAGYQDAHAKDAQAVELRVKQCTMRDLISYRIFPKPTDTSVQIFTDFGEKFNEKIDSLVRKMNARGAPTDMEVAAELTHSGHVDGSRSTAYPTLSRRRPRVRGIKQRPIIDVGSAIKDAFLEKRAKEISVYASEYLFGLYSFWTDYEYMGTQAIEDCWYSQIAFWLYEDAVDTIVAMNRGSDNVLTSPVKRLVGVAFNGIAEYSNPSGSGSTGSRSRVRVPRNFPRYMTENASSALQVEPWTTRICDEDIDVVHFSVSVVVESKAVLSFMKELCRAKEHSFHGFDGKAPEENYNHNQITILEYSQEPVVRDEISHEKYRYGNAAVVKLNMICEYIFYRTGYDEIKPEKVKDLLKPRVNTTYTEF